MSENNSWGVMTSQAAEDALRSDIRNDAVGFHGDIAAKEIHWFNAEQNAWVMKTADGSWQGWSSAHGADTELAQWTPWSDALDSSAAPYYRWFVGGQTNACFNLIDRHLLSGRGDKTAIIFEGDRWDPSKNGGRGGPVTEQHFSYRDVFLEVMARVEVFASMGLVKGDRIAFNLPNIPDQIFYMLAAQRMGIIYTPVFGGFSAKTLSDRARPPRLLPRATSLRQRPRGHNYFEPRQPQIVKAQLEAL